MIVASGTRSGIIGVKKTTRSKTASCSVVVPQQVPVAEEEEERY
jgi:hypothetical protein